MRTVNVHEAKSTLSQLLVEAAAGQDVVIARDGCPVARLVAIKPIQRTPGALLQQPGWDGFVFDPAAFAPMTEAELRAEGWPV